MMVVVLDDDEVFLGNHQVLAVDLAKDIRFEDVGRRPCGVEAGLEEHKRSTRERIILMSWVIKKDRQAQLLMQMLDQLDDIVLRRDI